jgi:membrane-associated protease RseP (regulator of RpoE activity)
MVQVGQAAFGDDERDPNGPISVVGVGRIAGEIASIDSIETQDRIASFLALLASLNIALFVFNLIPLLPLDGGHVAVALIDGIRRRFAKIRGQPAPRPTDPQRLMPLTLVVIAALISMSVLLMYADIVNPISLVQ